MPLANVHVIAIIDLTLHKGTETNTGIVYDILLCSYTISVIHKCAISCKLFVLHIIVILSTIYLDYLPDTDFWKGMMVALQDIILRYGISLQFGMQMLALLKHKLNVFCMHDGLENGRPQVGQDDYVEAIAMKAEEGCIGERVGIVHLIQDKCKTTSICMLFIDKTNGYNEVRHGPWTFDYCACTTASPLTYT